MANSGCCGVGRNVPIGHNSVFDGTRTVRASVASGPPGEVVGDCGGVCVEWQLCEWDKKRSIKAIILACVVQ